MFITSNSAPTLATYSPSAVRSRETPCPASTECTANTLRGTPSARTNSLDSLGREHGGPPPPTRPPRGIFHPTAGGASPAAARRSPRTAAGGWASDRQPLIYD